MPFVIRLAAAAAVLAALAAPALAQTDEQRAALAARIESFDAAMQSSNMKDILGVVPPKVVGELAATYNVTVEQMVEGMQQQIDEAMKTVKLESFGMDLENAQFTTLPDGTLYAFIPTETVMDMGESGKFRSKATTLGLLDGETWYLIRAEDPQQAAILKDIYPALADVTFPAGTMEPVTE